jgi:hypothetical protein
MDISRRDLLKAASASGLASIGWVAIAILICDGDRQPNSSQFED